MGTDVQFSDYEIYHVAMETAVGVLTGMGMPVLPGTAEEKWFMNIMTLFGFLFTTYATARFIELCNRSVAMSAEMTSRTSTIRSGLNNLFIFSKLREARFRVYQRHILQVNIRLKALDEIYKMC